MCDDDDQKSGENSAKTLIALMLAKIARSSRLKLVRVIDEEAKSGSMG